MSNWVKDVDGDLINLDHIVLIQVDSHQVTATIGSFHCATGPYTLFRGTPEECDKYRDDLFFRINGQPKE